MYTRTTRDKMAYQIADPSRTSYNKQGAEEAWERFMARFDEHNERRLKEGKPYEFALHQFSDPEIWIRILLDNHPADALDEGTVYPAIIYSGPMDAALAFVLNKPVTGTGKFAKDARS
jgi:hypothetical protein